MLSEIFLNLYLSSVDISDDKLINFFLNMNKNINVKIENTENTIKLTL